MDKDFNDHYVACCADRDMLKLAFVSSSRARLKRDLTLANIETAMRNSVLVYKHGSIPSYSIWDVNSIMSESLLDRLDWWREAVPAEIKEHRRLFSKVNWVKHELQL